MKYIPLHTSVKRCRPEPPLTKLHNDCGREHECARRQAANVNCRPTQDFSKTATAYGTTMLCNRFVSIAAAEHYRDAPADAKPMQAPT